MANIKIQNITKKYADIVALSHVSFEIEDKEFVVLFGPAGAGKTTLLSIVSGIQDYNEGSVFFGGKNMNDVSPDKRNVAMVFENYALYPHFTVYDNIAFPLRSPEYKTAEAEIKTMIHDVTTKMNINHLLQRYPSQLSNGQRQRVALGRAIVRKPNVFLMDEPLAHLDAKLKNAMRTELKAIQQQLDTTAIYVTHDYLEAMSLADKIIVINEGEIIQVATPHIIYYEPKNIFVAKLVGEPEINLYNCTFDSKTVQCEESNIKWNIDKTTYDTLSQSCASNKVLGGIRGVDIEISLQIQKGFLEAKVKDFHSIGNRYVILIEYQRMHCNTLVPGHVIIEIDQKIYFRFKEDMILFFNADTENFIIRNGEYNIWQN